MFGENVVEWTSKIRYWSHKGLYSRALSLFLKMQRAGIHPNPTTFSTVLTLCAKHGFNSYGLALHSLTLKYGYSKHLFVSSGLITVYFRSGRILDARKVFDEMPHRDGTVWNSVISGYGQSGLGHEACRLFCRLVRECVYGLGFVNDFTLASVINACGHVGRCRLGRSVHAYAMKVGFDSNKFVGSSLVDMYSKFKDLGCARSVFDHLRNRDIVVWNTMITGYAHNGYEEEAIDLFLKMELRGLSPNYTTFSAVINASSVMPDGVHGKYLHAKGLKFGYLLDVYVGTALVDMYAKCLIMTEAEQAFFEMRKKNVVSYNALITGYGLSGDHVKALETYILLRIEDMKPDDLTFLGLFTSVASSCASTEGIQIHSQSIKRGMDRFVLVGNSIVNFYSKCGLFDCAIRAFETVQGSHVVAWAAIISGLVQNNKGVKALEMFCEMHKLSKNADEFSSSSVIKAVASLGVIAQGRHLHSYVIKVGLSYQIFVGSSLIDMYSKCGAVEDAHKMFLEMPEKNIVSWNSVITGYAQNGFSKEAILLFHQIEKCNFLPNSVTFVGVLLACCHAGLVQEGRHYYQLMTSHFGISPSIEHCTCMVNLLGRSGYVAEAEEFLRNSPYKEELVIWKSLLASCEAHKDFNVAARVAEYCLHLNPDDSSTYTMLSNIYAVKHLWDEVGRTRDSMKMGDVAKEPGCSWIEVNY
ncbi:pentatricopeptide repeat-containing protein At4g13650-like [Silene latifolia]|uniref:pentatricopeptide repeat-containing protein At4g13650-like n=1 Tax=Silene latifolia TaxID=37657 RepID=UPI003D76B164